MISALPRVTGTEEPVEVITLGSARQKGDTSAQRYTVMVGNNMGNDTLLLTLPMYQFFEKSEVANAVNLADNSAFIGQEVAQRPLDVSHANKLAVYFLKGLAQRAIEQMKIEGYEIDPRFLEIQNSLGTQPYLGIQPITANIRECTFGGDDLVVEPLVKGESRVWTVMLSQKHILWIIDGQHRRHAMHILFEWIHLVTRTGKYPKRSPLYTPSDSFELTANEVAFWHKALEIARSRFTVAVEVHLGLKFEQERQLFHDLNNLGKAVAKNLVFTFDKSNPVNQFIREDLLESEIVAKELVAEKEDKDWDSELGPISRKDLIVVNALLFLNRTNVSGATPADVTEKKELAARFWEAIVEIPGFSDKKARGNTVAAQAVVLKALAKLLYGFAFGRKPQLAKAEELISGISKIDFSHANRMWRFYYLQPEEADAEFPGLREYLPEGVPDLGVWDTQQNVFRFANKTNDVMPVIGDMIRWKLGFPKRERKEEKEEA